MFRFTKNMKIEGPDLLNFQDLSPGHFYCMRGPSLVELTGDDNISPISTVAVQ